MKRDYSKSKIYKVVSDDPDFVMYGGTTDMLHCRLYKLKNTLKTKDMLKEQTGVKILLVENYPCDDVNELNARVYEVERSDKKG